MNITRKLPIPLVVLASLLGSVSVTGLSDELSTQEQVAATERAFAKTMADRDHEAFTQFLSEEAVFFSGPEVLHGKQAVSNDWARYFEGDVAPFSWEPERVEVLESGTLALSTGPVLNSAGDFVGTFTSIWRLESPGNWKVIFDKGNAACESPAQ